MSRKNLIIGAGAAGSVLASKLSEDPNVSVLLLEAGGDNTGVTESKMPLGFGKLLHTEHDWNYYTVEQPGLASRRLYWPRGRLIGGSTSINAMMYHHCSKSDFDEWASHYGCQGWSYDDLAPYFKRMERFTPNPNRPRIDLQHRGNAGEWQTGYSWLTEIGEKGFLPACYDVGIPAVEDINTPGGTLGATRFQTFIDSNGQRSSLATAYLTPEVRKRPNLFIACHAHVTKLLFDRLSGDEPTAIGAEFQKQRGGELFEVHARREVILSGGAVNTPQLLLLSGIGPRDELEKHGIPVVRANDAVGKNLKDHLVTTTVMCKAKAGTTLDYLGSPLRAFPSLARWMLLGGGPLTNNVGETAAFIRSWEHHPFPGSSSERNPPKDYTSGSIGPDVEIIGVPTGFIHHGEEPPMDGASRVPVNDDPWSYWWPYSSSDIDRITDDQLLRWMDEKAFTLYHPVGSARMGTSPENSVVDVQCRVHGVNRLRVMDASVFPEQISGHPTAPIGAMAYKLSDMIKQDSATAGPPHARL
ncbi:unnamed protein product [Aspergillus oryzae var. brunneus]|uniref:Unnamed protein product n=2 Tax=Aspergillus oryzae TaxID=5062 RepID=A0AAN4Y8J2_ASPOZ|nr:unnamed protein product [Aspergillus oryzae]GMG43061.1 unnamed protein product [Aspergillus oryzae var. brunneus]